METKKNIYKALMAFQSECPIIHKDTNGYNYTYADLSKIVSTITPLLKKHKLGFTQLIQGSQLQTVIFHESGESLESLLDMPQGVKLGSMNIYQSMGSGITYLRRYALSSALGLVTDKDIDATGEQSIVSQVDDSMKQELKSMVYDTDLSEDEKTAAFDSIKNCTTNDVYYKIKGRLESRFREPQNPNQTDIKRQVGKKLKAANA